MFGLPLLDVGVIVAYFAVIIAIGAWCSRRIKTEEDYFLAGRGFGKLIQTFATFGQGTSADNAVGVTTTTYVNGASGIWSSMLYLFATPFYWLICPWLRRLRLLTMGDFFLERYGSARMAGTYAVIGSIGMMAFIALGFKAMTTTIVAITPKAAVEFNESDRATYDRAVAVHRKEAELKGTLAVALTYEELVELEMLERVAVESPETMDGARLAELRTRAPGRLISHLSEGVLIWLVCLIVLVYAVAGGLEAAFLTDMLQGVFIILLSVILIPFAWSQINAMHGGSGMMDALGTIHARLPEASFDIFGSPHSVDFTWYYILAVSVMATVTVLLQPNGFVANASARDEYAARYGFTVGSFLKRVCTVFWGVFGLAAIVLYSHKVHNSDLVWGYASRDLLGPLNLGLVGLMIAALMAALMSTADCMMLACSSLLTHNLYEPLFPGRGARHYIWAGRAFGAIVLVGSVLIATRFDTILSLMKFIWEFNVMLAPAFWLGMKWRRANRAGAWASIVLAGMSFLVLPFAVPWAMPQLRATPSLLKMTAPEPLTRIYTAREADVIRREGEIAAWENLSDPERPGRKRPEALTLDEPFTENYRPESKSIFWTQGVKPDENGEVTGQGGLTLELVLLDRLGVDLVKNPYALNETIRIMIRTIVPFLIMSLFVFATRPDDRDRVARFYAKMRTKVNADPDKDRQELARSMEDVDRHRDRLLFPNSQWEFYRWHREDTAGFFLAVLAVGGILVLMATLVSLGA